MAQINETYESKLIAPLLLTERTNPDTGLIYAQAHAILAPHSHDPTRLAQRARSLLRLLLGDEVEAAHFAQTTPRTKPTIPNVQAVRNQNPARHEDGRMVSVFLAAGSALPEQRNQLLEYIKMTPEVLVASALDLSREVPPVITLGSVTFPRHTPVPFDLPPTVRSISEPW